MSLLRHATKLRMILPSITEARGIKRWVAPTMRAIRKRREKIGPDAPQPRSSYLEWNYDAEIFAFGKRLGEEFDEKLLRRALTSRSYALKEEEKQVEDNYSMVAEGARFVTGYVEDKLRETYPNEIVGAVRDYLTSQEMLGHVGKHMGLTDIILTAEFPVEISTISDTFMAVMAALKESSGDERAQKFLDDFLFSQLSGKDVYEIWDPKNPYRHLLSLLEENGITAVEPRLCNQSATNTILATFQVGLYSDRKLLGIGFGESIDVAKETAALDAIKRIHKNNSRINK